MRIAILGGTGKMGEGLACRWAHHHEIYIGSRDKEKAEKVANDYVQKLAEHNIKCHVSGIDNKTATEKADIVVLAVPYDVAIDLIKCLQPVLKDQIVVSIVVPMKKAKRFEYTPPDCGCGALYIKNIISNPKIKIVSAYHNISYNKLSNIDLNIEGDVIVCSDDTDAKQIVMDLTQEIHNLRPLDGGSLCESCTVESLTPFLINIANRNGLSDICLKLI